MLDPHAAAEGPTDGSAHVELIDGVHFELREAIR